MLKKIITTLLITIFCTLILALSIRGISGNPNNQTLNEIYWKDEGPLELSPERGKFALTYSIVEDNSVFFSLPLARFATPDLGFHNGKYVSLFAPGVSYITMPGYILGKLFGASQVGTYGVIALFAILNVLLIRTILLSLGVKDIYASLSGLTFLFATPAFAYGAALYQHHISTFVMLISILLLIKFKGIWPLLIIWFLLAVSLTVDSPNFFLMFPIGLYALGRLVYAKLEENTIKIGIKTLGFLTIVTAFIPLLWFAYFNNLSYGNPLQLSGTVAGVKAIDDQGNPATPKIAGTEDLEIFTNPDRQEKKAINFFLTRNLLNGFYIHSISPDRGVIYFTPVILLGFAGVYFLYKKNSSLTGLLIGLIGTNVLLYSMWGDPWGGWAFGSRYLIPSYAMLAIFLGFALMQLNRYHLFTALFLSLFIYSVGVNTVGAITSSRNPPQVEILSLEELTGIEQKYTYFRNFDMLNINKTKSFVFNIAGNKYLTAWQYYYLILVLITLPAVLLLIASKISKLPKLPEFSNWRIK